MQDDYHMMVSVCNDDDEKVENVSICPCVCIDSVCPGLFVSCFFVQLGSKCCERM